jgi:hypothetical protein
MGKEESHQKTQYVESTESCMYHPGKKGRRESATCFLLRPSFADLGYVGAGMPTTDKEAKEFAANVADPVKHLNDRNAAVDAGNPCC